jgi:CRP-like cAMP-binding protein
VLSATATVTVRGQQRGQLGPGDFFGEIALISENGLGTATTTPDSDLECLGLTAWTFKAFLGDHPDAAWAVLETMAKRVKQDTSS